MSTGLTSGECHLLSLLPFENCARKFLFVSLFDFLLLISLNERVIEKKGK